LKSDIKKQEFKYLEQSSEEHSEIGVQALSELKENCTSRVEEREVKGNRKSGRLEVVEI